jgi:LuxR family maltose regulon positive regulatory protein
MNESPRLSMSDTSSDLLSTKLALPRPRHFLVPRERLFSLLDSGLDHAVTSLAAPAGFGKTTAVRAWIASCNAKQQQFKAAWLSLDDGDNDPVRFWRYVIVACQRFDSSIGQASLQRLSAAWSLQPGYSIQYSFEALLTGFINDLNRLTEPCVLVIEDYHVIALLHIHEIFSYLLDHLPTNIHVILLSRSDLPLPLARLRGQGNVLEIRTADLRFSLPETRTFLQRLLPFTLSPEMIEHIYERTEGWGAGLNLLAFALRRYPDRQERERFVATLTGRYRPLLEYLVSDVLNTQPELLQTFLLQTSGLTRLTSSLCNAVTHRDDSGMLLEQLERANLFLDLLDGTGQWYRYHTLFAEAMRHEASRRLASGEPEACFQRASIWYEQHDLLMDAIEMSLEAADFTRAVMLIDRYSEALHSVVTYEIYTLRRWFEQIPLIELDNYPSLYLVYAMVLTFDPSGRTITSTEQVGKIEMLLTRVEQRGHAREETSQMGAIYALRSLLTIWQGDFKEAAAIARQALSYLEQGEEVEWRSACLSFIGAEEQRFGSLTVALQLIEESLALNRSAGVNPYGERAIKLALGDLYIDLGELHLAAEDYRQVLTEADGDLFDRGKALLGLSHIAYEWNNLDAASEQAQEALNIAHHLFDENFQVQAELVLARAQYARGDTEQATRKLMELVARTQYHPSSLFQREALFWQARLHLMNGDLSAVQRWIQQRPIDANSLPLRLLIQEDMLVARWLLMSDNPQDAQHLLEQCLSKAMQHAHTASCMEIEMLIALAHYRQSNFSAAVHIMQKILPLARAQGYQRLFLNEGEAMSALLQASEENRHEHPISPTIRSATTEALSMQEQRVLRLFIAGLSKPEIASELVVSTNTVKTHLRRIYRKLNISSRSEAREAVRHLHLL